MTTYYCNSATGNDSTGNGSSSTPWATVKNSLSGNTPAMVDGDTLLVDDGHSESYSASHGISHPDGSTAAKGITIISVDFGASYAYSRGAKIATTSGYAMTIGSGTLFWHGFDFECGGSWGPTGDAYIVFNDCNIALIRGVSGDRMSMGGVDTVSELYNCNYSFAHADQGFSGGSGCRTIIRGGAHIVGTTLLNGLIHVGYTRGQQWDISDLDASGLLATSGPATLVASPPANLGLGIASQLLFNNVKTPATYGYVGGSYAVAGARFEGRNIGNSSTQHNVYIADLFGVSQSNTAIYRSGGATNDGTTNYSIKVATTTSTTEMSSPHRILLSEFWAAAQSTLTVELMFDSNAYTDLDDDEAWIEVEYPKSTAGDNVLDVSTRCDPNAAATSLSTKFGSSSATWTDNWVGSEVQAKRKITLDLSATSPVSVAGVHRVYYCQARRSAALQVYVDPRVDIS